MLPGRRSVACSLRGDDYRRSGLGQTQGEGFPDAAACAGDDGDAA
jgi:hypothetical protein